MVTATNGLLVLEGINPQTGQPNGNEYALNIYISDVLAAPVTFNLNGPAVAGSPTFYITPELCRFKDVSITTGPTVMTNLVPQSNDVNSGSVFPIANCLTTITTRSFPRLRYNAGRKLTLLQA